jgi:hypothetical protein
MKIIKQNSWRRVSQSEIRNSAAAAAESESGQKFLVDVHSPIPFLFARPSVQFGARSVPSIPFKKGSDFVKQTHQYQTFRFLPDRFSRAERGQSRRANSRKSNSGAFILPNPNPF